MNDSYEKVAFDMDKVHETSMDLMTFLEERQVEHPTAVGAIALTLGRINSPKVLSPEEQCLFIEGILEWCALFHTKGLVN